MTSLSSNEPTDPQLVLARVGSGRNMVHMYVEKEIVAMAEWRRALHASFLSQDETD